MSLVVAAVRGTIGRTPYFMAKVPARRLGALAVPASEMNEWENWSISERIQRDVSIKRIKQELAPYLVRSSDRFYGSVIVTVIEADLFDFEPINERVEGLPAALSANLEDIGMLTIDGGQLVALDGQHRLVALREIVAGRLEAEGTDANTVGDDDVCVMFIQHESLERTRRIFNKVNRHARPTSPTDNIITSEDDGYAIITRWLTEHDPPLGLEEPLPPLDSSNRHGEHIVEWEKSNLAQFAEKITTLSALYQTVQEILAANGIVGFDEKTRVNRPEDYELEQAYVWAASWWTEVLQGMQPFRYAMRSPVLIRDMRTRGEPWSLLFRPVAQVALFRGLGLAVGAGLTLTEAVERAQRIDWRNDSRMWFHVIIRPGGRMLTKKSDINLTGRLIAYLICPDLIDEDEVHRLAWEYFEAREELADPSGMGGGVDPRSFLPPPVV